MAGVAHSRRDTTALGCTSNRSPQSRLSRQQMLPNKGGLGIRSKALQLANGPACLLQVGEPIPLSLVKTPYNSRAQNDLGRISESSVVVHAAGHSCVMLKGASNALGRRALTALVVRRCTARCCAMLRLRDTPRTGLLPSFYHPQWHLTRDIASAHSRHAPPPQPLVVRQGTAYHRLWQLLHHNLHLDMRKQN